MSMLLVPQVQQQLAELEHCYWNEDFEVVDAHHVCWFYTTASDVGFGHPLAKCSLYQENTFYWQTEIASFLWGSYARSYMIRHQWGVSMPQWFLDSKAVFRHTLKFMLHNGRVLRKPVHLDTLQQGKTL